MGEKVKKPFYKKWWVLLIVVVIIIMFLNSGGEEDKPTVVSNNEAESGTESTNNSNESEEEQSTIEEFTINEEIQLDDNILIVSNVERSNGDDFDQPKEGKEYVIVTIEIKNAGDDNISYNPFDFKMSNSQGQIVDQAFTIVDSDTALESGELVPGGNVSGTIVFEQPKGDTELQLQYTPGFWSDKTIKVNLQ